MVFRSMILDCAGVQTPDARAIDRLARLQLEAGRHGVRLRFVNVNQQLYLLIEFCGLTEVLSVQVERQAEQGEQPGGVQEERDLRDPAV
jgi:anti-anti-sigma regulatory factor